MEKLLSKFAAAYADAQDVESIVKAARDVKIYARKHPMAECLLSLDDLRTYRAAVAYVAWYVEQA